jgi:3-dehydroquinate synthase
MTSMATITVQGDRPYDVVVGHGAAQRISTVIDERAEKVAVLHAPGIDGIVEPVLRALRSRGLTTVQIELPDAEQAKTAAVLESCWRVLGDERFTRTDAIVSVGGGATTDAAGFVAASWLRGIDVVHIPTTTLAMVDAAIGGKTGINTDAGKNLVGAFHTPRAVLVDPGYAASLPSTDHVAGLAEVVKAGLIADTTILDILEADTADVLRPGSAALRDVVVRAIRVKAAVVSADLREVATSGPQREILNYGHTLGHAIERQQNYTWRHGDAVSVGMVFAAEVANAVDLLTGDEVGRHREILGSLGLPISYAGSDWPHLLDTMRIDKKARGSVVRLVLLDGIGNPVVQPAPAEPVLTAAFERLVP